jgi:tetratricopeptide (TPR) repeat protein
LAAENAGNLDEAAASFEQIAAILEVSLGERHPHYASALNHVAQVRRKQQRFGEAVGLFRSALAILEGVKEDASPKSDIATNIASMYLEIVEEIAPDPSRATADLGQILGEKPDDFTVSMRIRFPTPIEDELPVSNTMRWLDARAKFYESIGAFDKVEFTRQQAVELVSLVRGEHHADVLEPLDALIRSQNRKREVWRSRRALSSSNLRCRADQ